MPKASNGTNSIATCGSALNALLGVFAPDGSLLQVTYISGAAGGAPFIATGANSAVFVLANADTAFSPTQAGPFPAGFSSPSFLFLWRLSSNAGAQTLKLSCVTNAASFGTGPIAPGSLVTLFGSGLGPLQGVQWISTRTAMLSTTGIYLRTQLNWSNGRAGFIATRATPSGRTLR